MAIKTLKKQKPAKKIAAEDVDVDLDATAEGSEEAEEAAEAEGSDEEAEEADAEGSDEGEEVDADELEDLEIEGSDEEDADEVDADEIPDVGSDEVEAVADEDEESEEIDAEELDEVPSSEAAAEDMEDVEEADASEEAEEPAPAPVAAKTAKKADKAPAKKTVKQAEEAAPAADASEEAEASESDEADEEAEACGDEAPVAAPAKDETKAAATKKKADDAQAPEAAPAEQAAEGEGEESDEAEADAEGDESEEAEEAVAEDADEMIVEPITEASLDDANLNLDFVLCNAEAKNPHWLVLTNGEPLAKIALADQEDAETIREAFLADSYADSVRASITTIGAKEVLSSVKARMYHAIVRKAEAVKSIKAEVEQEVTARVASANDNYNEKLAKNMLLVVKADTKNFFSDPCPFKAALIHGLKKAGVEAAEAKAVVEEAFLGNGEAFFKRVMDKAAEYCSFTDESMRELTASIEGAGHRETEFDVEEARHEVTASATSKQPARGLPLTTYGKQATPSQRVAEAAGEGALHDRYSKVIRGLRRR